MKQRIICKALAVAVIILFLVVGIQPGIAVQPETYMDVEPKDYLFQTIIYIANDPDVKELFEQYKPEMFKFDIDRSVYRQILLRNPRLMFNTLFTKPSLSVEYLNKCYNNGIRITNILGEDKVIETIENFEFTDTKLFDELNSIISKDEELSKRLSTLTEMNNYIKTDLDYPIICGILFLLTIGFAIPAVVLLIPFLMYNEEEIIFPVVFYFLCLLSAIFGPPFVVFGLIYIYGCTDFPPY